MHRVSVVVSSLAIALCLVPGPASAQDVAITNVRVIVGNGTVINSGTIVVRGGKIVSVGPGGGEHAGPARSSTARA